MHNGNRASGEQTQCDKTLLAIGESVIFKGVSRAFNYVLCIDEIEPTRGKI